MVGALCQTHPSHHAWLLPNGDLLANLSKQVWDSPRLKSVLSLLPDPPWNHQFFDDPVTEFNFGKQIYPLQ